MRVKGGSRSRLEYVYCQFDVLDFETCSDYYNANNQSESGSYLVYLNARPYEVYCDFTNGKKPTFDSSKTYTISLSTFLGQGFTRFEHDKMNEEVIINCETEDCFKSEISYKESLELIDLIKERSSNCEQKIEVNICLSRYGQSFLSCHKTFTVFCTSYLQFNCFFSQLSSLGSWTDRHGTKLSYFSGDSGDNICQCGQASPNECFQLPHLNENKCNCDARDPVQRSDHGLITNKAKIILSKNYECKFH